MRETDGVPAKTPLKGTGSTGPESSEGDERAAPSAPKRFGGVATQKGTKNVASSKSSLSSASESLSHAAASSHEDSACSAESRSQGDAPLYQRLRWAHQFDPTSLKDAALKRRAGFYKFESDLGAGNFSKVKLGTHLLTKERVAIKIINKAKLNSKTLRMVSKEIQIMDKLSHPHLIRLYEVVETNTCINLVMEYAHGGELFDRLTGEKGPYPEGEARVVFAQIASAVEYMHGMKCIHRDLKAENVFFTTAATDTDVKVGDFGFATQVDSLEQHLNTFCGSPPYAAPELFQDDHYFGPSVDIWALGVLLFFIVSGEMPFEGSNVTTLKKAILEGRIDIPDHVSNECSDIIGSVLRRKPESRPTMDQIRNSAWLSGAPWPEPCTKYRVAPPPIHEQTPKREVIVRSDLEVLGISEDVLQSHLRRGARSSVIGTYRILLHKLIVTDDVGGPRRLCKANLGDTLGSNGRQPGWRKEDSFEASSQSSGPPSTPSTPKKPSKPPAAEPKTRAGKGATKKSRTCTIL